MSYPPLNSQSSFARLTAFIFLITPAFADTVTLVDGTKVEGEVISTTDELVVVRARVGGIWDEKRFDVGEVRFIERDSPEAKAWQDASVSLPTPDLLSRADYVKMIDKKLKPFLKEFPLGEHAEEAKRQLATLESELAKVVDGEVKFNGAWLSASEYSDRRYWVDAERIYRDLQASVERGSLITALRRFDELDEDYDDSVAYAAAVSEIRPVLEKYDRELSTAIIRAPGLLTQRMEMLATLSAAERALTENEIKRSDAEAKARQEKERANKMKWLTPNPYDESSLKAIQTTVRKELERVAKLEPAKLERRARVLELIDRTINEGSVEKAEELFAEHDDLLRRSNYLKALKEKLKAVIEERKQLEMIETTVSIEEEANGEKEKAEREKGEGEATTDEADNSVEAISDNAPEVVKTDIEVTEVMPKPVVTDQLDETPKAAPMEKSPNDGEAAEEDEESSSMMIIVVVALVLILVGAMVVNARGQKKKQES